MNISFNFIVSLSLVSDWAASFVCTNPSYKYGLLTKCGVKMAGYWPSYFFACLWTETKSRSINSQKKNEVNKGFIIWLSGKFFMRDTAGSPERARWLHLARSGSQSQRPIWFILPARGASHIIIVHYYSKCIFIIIESFVFSGLSRNRCVNNLSVSKSCFLYQFLFCFVVWIYKDGFTKF